MPKKILPDFNSLTEMIAHFSTEQSCIDYMTRIRWQDGKFCPYCGSARVYTFKDNRTHKCADCRQKFSIKVGTIFEDSKIPLQKWFMAIYLITTHKKGISSIQLGKDIHVTQKTAWFMNHRLREATRTKAFNAPLKNTVEVDEAYIGGKEKNKHANKRTPNTQGRNTATKAAIVAIVERQGEVRAFHVPDTQSQTLHNVITQNVALGSQVNTDEYRAYAGLRYFYLHGTVDHVSGKYVIGEVHTNTAESFFALFKRGVYGIYHSLSKKHLQRYLQEFSFRYNMRQEDNGAGFMSLLSNCSGRLTYKELITNEAA
jgi:transposase-like protein